MVKIEWQQLDSKRHKSGMRLECHCGLIEYFGDSPAGDLAVYKARDVHKKECDAG